MCLGASPGVLMMIRSELRPKGGPLPYQGLRPGLSWILMVLLDLVEKRLIFHLKMDHDMAPWRERRLMKHPVAII